MNFWVADPHWGWWVIAYFFLGGIAGGSYFLAVMMDWFGRAEDRALSRIAYWLALPLIVICGVLLIVDLYRPERFWHMLLKSEIVKAAFEAGFPFSRDGWQLAAHAPALKYWSVMSLGAWALTIFGACTAVSWIVAVWPGRRIGRWLKLRWVYYPVQAVGCVMGFFVASYTGTLLSTTNQPVWSDTSWIASLFLVSAVSTSLAAMTLIAEWKGIGSGTARRRLAGSEPWALGLELVVLTLFLASLGVHTGTVLTTWRGMLLLVGVVVLGVLVPLFFHAALRHRSWSIVASASLVLLGGLLLRYSIVTLPTEILRRGPSVLVRYSPEAARQRGGGPGGDPKNYTSQFEPRSKLLQAEP